MTIIYVTKRYANDSGVDSNDERRRRITISATSSIDFSFLRVRGRVRRALVKATDRRNQTFYLLNFVPFHYVNKTLIHIF